VQNVKKLSDSIGIIPERMDFRLIASNVMDLASIEYIVKTKKTNVRNAVSFQNIPANWT
jgi:hypothetical protein